MDLKSVCVILPCFNEEASLEKTVDKIRTISNDIEILVINNASTDNTKNIAKSLGAKTINENKKGKGFAVRKGFSSLDRDFKVIILVDADDTYDLSNMQHAINLVSEQGYDMAVGNRIQIDKDLSNRASAFRTGHVLGNFILSKLNKLLHPTGINDSLSGYRVFSRGFVNSFTGGASGFEIEAETNAHAYFIKAAVTNFDVEYYGRHIGSVSKLNTYKDGFKILFMNLKIFRTYRPKFAFSMIAVFWLAMSLFLLYRPIESYLETGLVPQFPSLIAGVGTFIISVQLWITGITLDRINILHLNNCRLAYKNNLDNR